MVVVRVEVVAVGVVLKVVGCYSGCSTGCIECSRSL